MSSPSEKGLAGMADGDQFTFERPFIMLVALGMPMSLLKSAMLGAREWLARGLISEHIVDALHQPLGYTEHTGFLIAVSIRCFLVLAPLRALNPFAVGLGPITGARFCPAFALIPFAVGLGPSPELESVVLSRLGGSGAVG